MKRLVFPLTGVSSMYRPKSLIAGAFLILILSGVTSPAKAGFIDLRSLPGNFDQSAFGQTNTVLYAQSVIADDVFMNEARATLRSFTGTNLDFNFMITGSRSDVGGLGFAPNLLDIRFNSGTLTGFGKCAEHRIHSESEHLGHC